MPLKDLIEIRANLRRIENYKYKGQNIRVIMNWIREGDRGSKYFFTIIKYKQKHIRVEEIGVDSNSSNTQR